MKKILTLGLCLAFGSSLLLMNSCKKITDQAEETEELQAAAEDFADLQTALDDELALIFDVLDNTTILQKNGNYDILPGGEYITWYDSLWNDGLENGVSFKIEFGDTVLSNFSETTGIACNDGKYRKGFIEMAIPQNNRDESNSTIRLISGLNKTLYMKFDFELRIQNFGPGRFKCELTSFAYEASRPARGPVLYNVEVSNISYDQIEGLNTEAPEDDVHEFSSNKWSIKSPRGQEVAQYGSYEVTNEVPLVLKHNSCANTFVKGKTSLKVDGNSLKVDTDFGNGDCDNFVEITFYKNNTKLTTKKFEVK